MSTRDKIFRLQTLLAKRGRTLDFDTVAALRRAEMTLHRWAEKECGDSNDYFSYCVVRDEGTGKTYLETTPHTGKTRRTQIADLETGALRRVKKICADHALFYFHQTDPRGCALYIGTEEMSDSNYSSLGLAICD